MTIDWTKPIELIDGTPVMVSEGPDPDGDYWIKRIDEGRIKALSKDSLFKAYAEMCVCPDGKFEGERQFPAQVRNVK